MEEADEEYSYSQNPGTMDSPASNRKNMSFQLFLDNQSKAGSVAGSNTKQRLEWVENKFVSDDDDDVPTNLKTVY